MILGYYVVVAVILLVAGPFLLCIKKCRYGVAQKLGFIPNQLKASSDGVKGGALRRVWVHAVSVGEFNAVCPLIQKLHKRNSNVKLFVSTTTGTGQAQAVNKVSDIATVFYFPFDLPSAINSWLDFVKPDLVLIVETEIWPGFLHECRKRGISVVLINGRLSPNSFKGYMRWRWFFSGVLENFKALSVQSASEANRYAALAGTSNGIVVSGNIKIDGIKAVEPAEAEQLRMSLGLAPDDKVLVGGSTHEGEESALLACSAVRENKIKLILVPRHPERFGKVATQIEAAGYRVRSFSANERFEKPGDVYLLDTIGQLTRHYSVATIAFVGGTIARVGGHSLAEPCAYSCPVVCGPFTFKTRDIAISMLEKDALVQVRNIDELHQKIEELVSSPATRTKIGVAGRAWLSENEGALDRTLAFVESMMHRNPELAGVVGQKK